MIATTVSIMLNDSRFGKLDDREKPHVAAKHAAMRRIDAAGNKRVQIDLEAARTHAGRKYSRGAIHKLYYDRWVAGSRDWTKLINRSRVPQVSSALPAATIERWHELCYQFRGKHKAAHRALQRAWEAGEKIPGFEEETWAPELPRGLSYDNLMRKKYRPTAYADKVASIGIAAAAEFAPGLLSTRVGLPFGSKFVFDDIWHDFKVNVPGQMGARRLLQFHCLELLSAHQCARGMKPEMLNDRTGRFERLKERELLFLLAHVLGNVGFNPEGCELMMEHGTASVAGRVEAFLSDISGGKLKVGRGGISGSPLAPGLYAGRGKGNFRFKAALESLGNLVHNETADRLLFPAQTGSNSRVNAPEELHGQEKHHDALVVAMLALPPALRDLVRLPATPLSQALEFADLVQERMNDRTEHELEGWAQCGFVTSEYRVHPTHRWQPMTQLLELPESVQVALRPAIETDKQLSRQRNLSPREVFECLRPQLTRIRSHHIPTLIGMENSTEHSVAKTGRFEFGDEDLGPGDHVFNGIVLDEEGHQTQLQAGDKFATFVSTLDPMRLHVCNAKGAYLGWAERTYLPTRGDPHGYARAAGQKMKEHRKLLAPVLAAAQPIIRRQAQDAEVNNEVFRHAQGAPSAPEVPAPAAVKKKRRNLNAELAAISRESGDSTL